MWPQLSLPRQQCSALKPVLLSNCQPIDNMMLHALVNATCSTACEVFSVHNKHIRTTEILPRAGNPIRGQIQVCKLGAHYDGITRSDRDEKGTYPINPINTGEVAHDLKYHTSKHDSRVFLPTTLGLGLICFRNSYKMYQLPYNPDKKMKLSKDGQPWKTWATTSRTGFATLFLLINSYMEF